MLLKAFFIFILLLPVFAFTQQNLTVGKYIRDKVEMLIPDSLHPMTEEEYAFKYHNSERPSVVLTDKKLEVNLIINYMAYTLQSNDVATFKDTQLKFIKQKHPGSKVLADSIRTVNGRKQGYLKFITQATDQKVFNYFVLTYLDNKLLLLTFNCTEALRPVWEKTADAMFASLKLKDN